MKLSTLIKELQSLQSMFGDINVVVVDNDDTEEMRDPSPTLISRTFKHKTDKFISLNSREDR